MDRWAFEDRLELLGVVLGVFLVLAALGSLAGMPWETNPDLPAVLLQVVGIALTIAVGVALVLVVRTD